MPEAASNFWKNWLDNIETILDTPDNYDWPLENLKDATRTEPVPPPSVQLPSDLQSLIDKETEPTREVGI